MKQFNNITDFVKDDLKATILPNSKLSIAAACFSIYAYRELKEQLDQIDELRFIFTSPTFTTERASKAQREFYIPQLSRERSLYGSEFEIKLRNELTQKAIAHECAEWIRQKVKFRSNTTNENIPGFLNIETAEPLTYMPLNGFTTVDIGCERGNNAFNMVNRVPAAFSQQYIQMFNSIWNDKSKLQDVTESVIESISSVYRENSPDFIYFVALYNIFSEFLEDISEDDLPNEAVGFKQSCIWGKLYDFQKDAVLAIINKLEKFNGCILADSVGLGKTFTALAVVKYYESRNKSVLVLCPKKLANNWNTYKANYRNNPIVSDRLRYDVLFHTDLSRENGDSNGIKLSALNWENYDLVVIDESHNFRNGGQIYGDEDKRENRYLRLMNKIIKPGVKTKVLMLSATPVNNRFVDLRNQIALAYEGDSASFDAKSPMKRGIDEIFRRAQGVFNAWSKLPVEERTAETLLETLDFDFFELLDSVTIARSRKHIEKYYDTAAIGKFPERLTPLSLRPRITNLKEAINYSEIYDMLERLTLSVYLPSNFVFPSALAKYNDEYGSDMGNIFAYSNGLGAYEDRFVITKIDGRDNSVTFLNGVKITVGDIRGEINEPQLRRLQIRETIISHFERERQLFSKGIKVLSLFFIDEVANYKVYNEAGVAQNGTFAEVFEQEYESIRSDILSELNFDPEYRNYIESISANATHAGYFSIDKKSNRIVNSDTKEDKKRGISNDVSAYDLIMKNKERLLDFREPVRFIFSHSALREGWDNPNVFQICTLKQSSAEVRKRQEVGRGLRLCVNQAGERMDENTLGADVHKVNVLTVIASESYDAFAKALQTEYAEAVSDRPCKIDVKLFTGRTTLDSSGAEIKISKDKAQEIVDALTNSGYIDSKGVPTDKYYDDKRSGKVELPDALQPHAETITKVLDNIYDPKRLSPEDSRKDNVSLTVNQQKLDSKEFKSLWEKISAKTAYCVEFNSEELVKNAIRVLDEHLDVPPAYFNITSGQMDSIESKESLESGNAFSRTDVRSVSADARESFSKMKYDIVGKIVAETGLTRKTIVEILKGIRPDKFAMFKSNPEAFILRASRLIEEQKATTIVQHIKYEKINDSYDTSIFTEPNLKGRLNFNAIETPRHLYDYLISDSKVERDLAKDLENSGNVAMYVKLPTTFYINTPVGHYSPDWAIVFKEGDIKHIYFIAETKGDLSTLNLREVESAKISCAKKHFEAISPTDIKYDAIHNYSDLMSKVMR